jgi:hypothetical protein
VGRFGDNSYTGAAWVIGRNGTIWTQQGNKLVGTGAVERATQGVSGRAVRRSTPDADDLVVTAGDTARRLPLPRVRPTMSIIAATSPVIGQPAGGSPYLSTSVYWTLIGHSPPASR